MSNSQAALSNLIVVPTLPSLMPATYNTNADQLTATIITLVQAYLEAKLKLKIILKK